MHAAGGATPSQQPVGTAGPLRVSVRFSGVARQALWAGLLMAVTLIGMSTDLNYLSQSAAAALAAAKGR